MQDSYKISYIDLLKEEYFSRKNKNALYSLRSFAKQIDLTPAYVSMVFRGKRHLSQSTALKIAKNLKWSREKQKYFANLLEFENPNSEDSKETALTNLQNFEDAINYHSLEVDTYAAISEWHHNAILILLNLLEKDVTTSIISKRLKLGQLEVEHSLNRLKRLGLVKSKMNYWSALCDYLKVQSAPSQAIRTHHKQHLTLAATAIEEQSFNERDFSNMTITIDPSQMEYAKKRIAAFHDEMAKLLVGKNPTEVYQLSVQLFRLTQPLEKE